VIKEWVLNVNITMHKRVVVTYIYEYAIHIVKTCPINAGERFAEANLGRHHESIYVVGNTTGLYPAESLKLSIH